MIKRLQEDLLKNNKKLVFGSEKNLKLLKRDKLERVYLASNCREEIKEAIKKGKIEIIELKIPNNEMGVICKKPFGISVIGLTK